MPKNCSSCGAEVKEGFKFCLSCGAQLQAEAAQLPPAAPVPPPQNISQTQTYAPMQPKKTNMKLIGILIAVIAAVVIVALVVFLFIGGGATDSRFVGEWEQFSDYISVTWDFKSGGSLEIMDIEAGTWSVSGDKLCVNPSSQWGGSSGEMCYNFEFSDNGNTLTLTIAGVESAVLTKK